MLFIELNQLQRISIHATLSYPQECCGLLLGTMTQEGKILREVRETENSWTPEVAELLPFSTGSKRDRFYIDPKVLLQVQKEARQHQLVIMGIYHSHCDQAAIPSECDRLMAWSEYTYLIVSVCKGQVKAIECWQLDEHHQFQSEKMEVLG